MTTAIGWHSDGCGHLRWWDGRRFTSYVAEPAPSAAPRAAALPSVGDTAAPLPATEASAPRSAFSLPAAPAAALLTIALWWPVAALYAGIRAVVRALRAAMSVGLSAQAPPRAATPLVLGAVSVDAAVLALIADAVAGPAVAALHVPLIAVSVVTGAGAALTAARRRIATSRADEHAAGAPASVEECPPSPPTP